MTARILAGLILGFSFATICQATTHYVDVNSTGAAAPYLSWATAASNIQDAVDASVDGDVVLVTNGVYATGGRAVNGFALTNRVVIDKPITVQSVNGAAVTTIQGFPVLGTNAVRCVYLTNGASLVGFTLTQGSTLINGDAIFEQSGGGAYCESNAILSGCVLTNNSAENFGGGVCQGILNSCTISGNTAAGGGAYSSTLSNCLVSGNSCYYGGGTYNCSVNNSVLSLNQGNTGGAACGGTLNNCIVRFNSAQSWGGGAYNATLNNSLITTNTASLGGGTLDCTANNCTLVGNSAPTGGGACQGTLNDCIVFYNQGSSGANYSTSGIPSISVNYCCTLPLPPTGSGSITSPPLFLNSSGDFHLQSNSPCINAGNNSYVVGNSDLDGNSRIVADVVDVGAFEYQIPIPLVAAIQVQNTNVATGFALAFQAIIGGGQAGIISWDFGDGTVITNQPTVSHSWTVPGTYTVILTASNEFTPGGAIAAVAVNAISQPVSYVNPSNAHPVAPYFSWDTAATNIQNAIDVAYEGGTVLVTNGVYQTGSIVSADGGTNRVVINHSVTVESVNGPAGTIIDGGHDVRCVCLTNGGTLEGFTLTNGYAANGGGVWCASSNEFLLNCVLISNSCVSQGGGAFQGTLNNCVLTNNCSGSSGGGCSFSVLSNCIVSGNFGLFGGGGANGGTLYNCIVSRNIGGNPPNFYYTGFYSMGGGAAGATLVNCVVSENSAGEGGGVYAGTVMNSIIAANNARRGHGGGTGGGIYNGKAWNSIVYYNTASFSPNGSAEMDHCCTFPAAYGGTGNTTNEPALASLSHISLNSPCRGAGNAAVTVGVDIDGEPWANPPSIGCDELYPGAVTGTPSVAIEAAFTNVPVGYPGNFIAEISGKVDGSTWDFGDGTTATNLPVISHTWASTGDYAITLYAYNDSYPNGVTGTLTVHVYTPTNYYVASSNNVPIPPYDTWAKAATNIQDAIDVAVPNSVVIVSNGVYNFGARTNVDGSTNRVAVWKPLILQSVNGSAKTLIDGAHTMRCVYLTNGAELQGFTIADGNSKKGGGVLCDNSNTLVTDCTLISNSTLDSGGALYLGAASNCVFAQNSTSAAYLSCLDHCQVGPGNSGTIYGCVASNCTIFSNLTFGAMSCVVFGSTVSSNLGTGIYESTAVNCKVIANSAGYGGGAYQSTLTNCLIAWNSAGEEGGGANISTLVNCTVVSNTAGHLNATGAAECKIKNCIIYYNKNNGNLYVPYAISNSCTFPLPVGGVGNFTNAPLFDSEFRLQSNSPCINAGDNAISTTTPDLDGNPRVQGGTVDLGAYEFQSPSSILSYAWAQTYGLPTDGSADFADMDGDGVNNWQEWIAGTNPTNSSSLLEMLPPAVTVSNGITISWQSVTNRMYYLQRDEDLGAPSAFTSLESNIIGQDGVTFFNDTTATNDHSFYRVGVQGPSN